jgi:YD repeat-containing protein
MPGGLVKARNDECGFSAALPFAKTESAALQALAGPPARRRACALHPTVFAGQRAPYLFQIQSRQTKTTDAKAGLITLGYAAHDAPESVTDPRNLLTQTPRDGLGQVLQVNSPDTGITGMSHDAAGNLTSSVDNRGVQASYAYDALNRPTSLTFSKPGSTSQTYTWTYDQTGGFFTYGIDRLTTASFPEGSSRYAYDAHGRPTQVEQTLSASGNNPALVLTTSYAYTAAGKLASIAYPSGRNDNQLYRRPAQRHRSRQRRHQPLNPRDRQSATQPIRRA